MKTMDVGTVDNANNTFDIDVLDETDSVLTRSATQVRWIWKNENNEFVILTKARPVVGEGAFVEIEGSVGHLTENTARSNKTVGILMKPYSRAITPAREVIVGSEVVLAYLQKVKLV
jgi:hypothetical protein